MLIFWHKVKPSAEFTYAMNTSAGRNGQAKLCRKADDKKATTVLLMLGLPPENI